MAKRGSVGSALAGLRQLGAAIAAMKGGRVDVGFFAGQAERGPETTAKAVARSRRTAKYVGAGSKPGFYKQGVEYAKRRAQMATHEQSVATSNPELAAKHEYGIGVPKRSMLRMPLHLHGDRVLKDAKADVRNTLTRVDKITPQLVAKRTLQRLGIGAENLVQDAFDTRGFGSWKPNAPLTIALKGSDSPLINEGQLRRAVDSRVVL